MRRIAITGGIAEGKSTVLGYLRELGYAVESSDTIAREVFKSPDVQAALAELLGVPAPIAPDLLRKELDKAEIRRAVNSLTHPRILRALQATPAAFIEVPLLVETCLQDEFDRVWVVTCGPEEQMRRLVSRLGNREAAEAQIRTQLTSRAKIPFGDRLIRTNQDESSVMRCVTVAAQQELR